MRLPTWIGYLALLAIPIICLLAHFNEKGAFTNSIATGILYGAMILFIPALSELRRPLGGPFFRGPFLSTYAIHP